MATETKRYLSTNKNILWDYDGTLRRRVRAETLGESKPKIYGYNKKKKVILEQRPRVSELIGRLNELSFVNLITTSNLREIVISELKQEATEYDNIRSYDEYNAGLSIPARNKFRPAGRLDTLFPEENIFCREQLGSLKNYSEIFF